MDAGDFEDPWEHVRLLTDRGRNDALVRLLERHAAGARVLEVGCGMGLLSCLAARLGARRVWAVEPTSHAETAARLVEDNGLSGVVTVVRGLVQDVEPHDVDLAFSELLNADPYSEGVLPAMAAARRWVVPGGIVAPRRLRVWVALTEAHDNRREVRLATREVRRLGALHGLDVEAVVDALEAERSYRYASPSEPAVSPPVLVHDLEIGVDAPPERLRVELPVTHDVRAGGAIVWFEADLCDDVVMTNAPGRAGDHWGRMVCGWSDKVDVPAGEALPVEVVVTRGELDVLPL